MVSLKALVVFRLVCTAIVVDAWMVVSSSSVARRSTANPTILFAGGFGGAGEKQTKDVKLKPKQQWDRYTALKKERPVAVAVKVADEWLEVGSVKSKDSGMTDIAVARQRALIAEVRRKDNMQRESRKCVRN